MILKKLEKKNTNAVKPEPVTFSTQAYSREEENPILKELERRENESRKTDALEEKLTDIQKLLQEKLLDVTTNIR